MRAHERIILPLDVSSVDAAIALVNQLSPYVGVFKVGFEAVYSTMAELLLCPEEELMAYAMKIRSLARAITPEKAFPDAKLADISNTVGKAAQALSRLQVCMFNMHASAGMKAIKAAVANKGTSKLFGVTVLTDIDEDECKSIFGDTPGKKVVQFSQFLLDYGADGVICAPAEGLLLRQDTKFDGLEIATPNVRPPWMMTAEERARVNDDQDIKRQLTPAAAMKARIDRIVIGRPITNPSPEIGGPEKAAQLIAQQMAEVTGEEV